MRILLIGHGGQVGHELLPRLRGLGEVMIPTRDELDLLRPEAAADVIRASHPDLIVNAAAYTDVDGAESDEATARALNAFAVAAIAETAADLGAPLVHYSTDYVFDGAAETPIPPGAQRGPINAYGRTKLEGEHLLASSGAAALLLRTAWVYSNRRRNFMRTIERLAAERDELRIVADQHGSPTPASVIAEATVAALPRWLEGGPAGVATHHVACRGATTWFGFARAIVAAGERTPTVTPITTAEFPTPAARPAYSVLDTTSFEDTFEHALPGWEDAFERESARRVVPT